MPVRLAIALSLIVSCGSLALPLSGARQPETVRLTGEVRDSASNALLPARVYILAEDGTWHFPRSQPAEGSAVTYKKKRPDNPRSLEMHTTLSAHPFTV